jgi:hypothetical protein
MENIATPLDSTPIALMPLRQFVSASITMSMNEAEGEDMLETACRHLEISMSRAVHRCLGVCVQAVFGRF